MLSKGRDWTFFGSIIQLWKTTSRASLSGCRGCAGLIEKLGFICHSDKRFGLILLLLDFESYTSDFIGLFLVIVKNYKWHRPKQYKCMTLQYRSLPADDTSWWQRGTTAQHLGSDCTFQSSVRGGRSRWRWPNPPTLTDPSSGLQWKPSPPPQRSSLPRFGPAGP